MTRLRRTALGLGLAIVTSCRIEEYSPTGSRHDEEAVQELVARYARTLSARDWSGARALFWSDATYAGPLLRAQGSAHQAVPIDLAITALARRVDGFRSGRFDVRVLRSDYRQEGDLAAVWVTTRRLMPVGGSALEGDWIEHLVFRRINGEWKILDLAATASPRGGPRGDR